MNEANETRRRLLGVIESVSRVIAGKNETVRWLLVALICRGHVLIEDVPGVGKTTLAQALAASLDTDFGRIQFTADLLPADIVGVEIFDPAERRFVFHPGPIFHHIVLADEINRATPKAQSALLEAMAEGQVTIERETHPLPDPFFVIATQNPVEQLGTFPLPESQLDRFFLHLSLGYPDSKAERRLLLGEAGREHLNALEPVADWALVARAREEAGRVHISDALMDYVLNLISETRNPERMRLGASPRAARDLVAAARTVAWLDGRDYATAADVQACWKPCLGHRVAVDGDAEAALMSLLESVPVPA